MKLLSEETPQGSINAKPLDYAMYDIAYLGSRTRDIVERASASIELVCYFLLAERKGNAYSNVPLGKILSVLDSAKVIPPKLYAILRKFNKHVFIPAKHDYEIYPDKQHLFYVP